jgi:hypothetical protein
MAKAKHKMRKLTDEQYNEYIATLKENAALYCDDGKIVVPPQIDIKKDDKRNS